MSASKAFQSHMMPRTFAAVLLSVMLVMSSTIAHAAWTANAQASTTATNGKVGITSNGTVGSSLAHAYTPTSLTRIGAITLTNTGSVPLEIRRVAIAAQAAPTNVPPSQVGIVVWAPASSACGVSVPGTVLASGTLELASLPLSASQLLSVTVPRTLCVATTLNGGTQSQAGKTVSASLTFNAGVASSLTWTASDVSNTAFLQQVPLNAPVVSCVNNSGYGFTLDWEGPSGATYVAQWRSGTTGAWSSAVPATSPQVFTNFSEGIDIGNSVRQIRINTMQGGSTLFTGTPISVRYDRVLIIFTTPRCG